jgi:hypothetical protein
MLLERQLADVMVQNVSSSVVLTTAGGDVKTAMSAVMLS